MRTTPNLLDRLMLAVAPRYGLERLRFRQAADLLGNGGRRNFDAAKRGRRTQGWIRTSGDANAVNRGALAALRENSRDLVRNNSVAGRGVRLIANGVVGKGIIPKATDKGVRASASALKAWNEWADTSECDVDGRLDFYGLQRLAMRTVVESGECLVRRINPINPGKLAIPLQLQVLEPDMLDTTKDGISLSSGGRIIQGVEFDARWNRVAYWLYEHHPGSYLQTAPKSHRVPASEVKTMFEVLRPGQVRGIPWFAPVIVKLKDQDEYDDATLMKQKVAALFTAFVKDVEADSQPIGDILDPVAHPEIETMEPGSVIDLAPGRDVEFATPPTVGDYKDFTAAQLRSVAVGLGVTYEGLSGDFSQVNFSSARMSRIIMMDNIEAWRSDMIIPQFCAPIWTWAQEAAHVAGKVPRVSGATWTPPPFRMIEPDKEGLATMRNVRGGLMTPSEAVRERGYDFEDFLDEYAEDLKELDSRGIVLDSDARQRTQAGNPVTGAAATGDSGASDPPSDPGGSGSDGSGDGSPDNPPQ